MNPSSSLWRQAVWMKPKDPDLLRAFIKSSGNTYATLARKVEPCSRQMIWALAQGDKTCSPALAHRIAAALDVPLDVIFLTNTSRFPVRETSGTRQKKAA